MKVKLFKFFLLILIFAGITEIAGCSFFLPEALENMTVDSNGRMQKEWTILVYMAADNDLECYALQNLKDMEYAVLKKRANVLVLLDRAEGYDETDGNWTDTRLFEVKHDSTNGSSVISKRLDCPSLGLSKNSETELDMANGNVLRKFIEFGKAQYAAKKYALIIWGHGTGWRYSVTEGNLPVCGELLAGENTAGKLPACKEESAGGRAVAIDQRTNSYMSVSDLGKAVKNEGLSLIGFDTCFGAVFENIYELKDSCEYIAAVPGVSPSCGWKYKYFLEALSSSDFEVKTAATLMAQSSTVKASVFDCKKLSLVMQSLEDFSKELAGSVTDDNSRNGLLAKLKNLPAYSYNQYPCDLFLDIRSMANAFLQDECTELARSAQKLCSAMDSAAFSTGGGKSLCGIHFIPMEAEGVMATSHSKDYIKAADNTDNTEQCAFIKESRWWVPASGGKSESLLDKLFYRTY